MVPNESTNNLLPPQTDIDRAAPNVIYVNTTTVQSYFRDDIPAYSCCCYQWHITTGTRRAAIADWVITGITLVACMVVFIMDKISIAAFLGILFGSAVAIGAGVSLWYAVLKFNPHMVVPFIVVKILQIIALVIWLVIIFIGVLIGFVALSAFTTAQHDVMQGDDGATSKPYSVETVNNGEEATTGVWFTVGLSILMATCICAMIADVWFLLVAIRCRRYLADRNYYCSAGRQEQKNVSYEFEPLINMNQLPTNEDAPPAYSNDEALAA